MTKRILIVGATGLVGRHLTEILAQYRPQYDIHILIRRALGPDEPAFPVNITVHIAPPEEWSAQIAQIKPDAAASCLGTTIRDAGSQAAFRAVDLELVADVAQAAKTAGCGHFLSVSSLSANSKAALFYMRTKGEAEDAIRACGFARTDIMQPGLLRGDRRGPVRYAENFAAIISPLSDMMLWGAMRKYRSIAGRDVARAMAALLAEEGAGDFIHTHDDIVRFAAKIGG
ncbi:NAD-dependent epimerase/dehydratase family protein [Sphingorhabdus arenilitoris]|uniref:NAD-dependent epimerase/dehydratase family protein n=1 Tax=Sphingorhabdus arenilitoris TaxID=1490041 RepID=A0ABV8REL2_9SPHN